MKSELSHSLVIFLQLDVDVVEVAIAELYLNVGRGSLLEIIVLKLRLQLFRRFVDDTD